MVIHKLKATFGCLDGDTLELKDGLNVINAPNESGKSTWCAFIRAMLYGIDSSERAKSGYLPDKTHYAPWTGKPMSGTMELSHGGRDITLTRSTKAANAPMRQFSATYTGTLDAVPGIDASNVGEYLTGASREVFCSSAFIGQGAAAVRGSTELERRIASVVSSGEEEVSAGEADERLRAWQRRRRYNKRGAIPELANEIARSEEQLRRVADTVAERERVGRQLDECRESAGRLSAALKAAQERERAGARQSFERSGERVSELEWEYAKAAKEAARLEAESADKMFGGMSAAEAASLAESEREKAEELCRRGEAAPRPLWFGVCAALAVLFAVLAAVISPFELIGTAVFAALSAWQYTVFSRAKRAAAEARSSYNALLAKYGARSPEELTALAGDYAARRAAADEAARALESAKYELERARAARRRRPADRRAGERGAAPSGVGARQPERPAREPVRAHVGAVRRDKRDGRPRRRGERHKGAAGRASRAGGAVRRHRAGREHARARGRGAAKPLFPRAGQARGGAVRAPDRRPL